MMELHINIMNLFNSGDSTCLPHLGSADVSLLV